MADVKNFGLSGVSGDIALGKNGPRIKDSSGTVQIRNASDAAYANLEAAPPTSENHVATKSYVDRKGQIRVVAQVINDVFRELDDSGVYTPSAGDVAVVTTVGSTYDTLGRLVRYNGSSWAYLFTGGETDGTMMQTGDAVSGGTDTYLESHVYIWETNAWVNVGPVTSTSDGMLGAQATLAYTGSSGTLKASVIGRAVRLIVKVTTAFNGTAGDATLTIGDDTDPDRLGTAAEIDLYTTGTYVIDVYHDYDSSTDIEYYYTADTNTDASAGSCTIELQYIAD